jgi:hypothetical protein
MEPANQVITVTGISNQEFLARYAGIGRIGLSGGVTPIDLAISRAERHLDGQKRWGIWSHAFFFQGARADGHHWVIESDLQFHRKHVQLGVQENRVSKYHNEKFYTSLAVLDFGLTNAQSESLLRRALDLVADREGYSLRELIGTIIALRRPALRASENLLARERCLFCSAFVRHLFRETGIDLSPGVNNKHTTPEDIANTLVPHTTYLLLRETARDKIAGLKSRIRDRLNGRIRRGPKS